jgi:hypothetical protein
MLSSVGAASIDGMQDEAPATTASMLTMPGFRHGVDCSCCTPGKSPSTMNQQAAFMGDDTVTAPLSDAVQRRANLIGLNERADDDLKERCQEDHPDTWRGFDALYIERLSELPKAVRIDDYVGPLNQGAEPNV